MIKKSLQEIVCNNLIKIRTNLGFSQRVLAKKCDVTAACICSLEKGRKLPSLGVLKKITEVLNISIADIVEEELCGDIKLKSFYTRFKILENLREIDQQLITQLCERIAICKKK